MASAHSRSALSYKAVYVSQLNILKADSVFVRSPRLTFPSDKADHCGSYMK